MENKGKLGRGLDLLMQRIDKSQVDKGEITQEIDVNLIRPNPYQPRKVFKKEEIDNLASSIEENGLMSPIILRKMESHYEIIAGERRWQATRKLGYTNIKCIVRSATKDQMITLSIIENIQREDLNPIEKGHAFKQMMEELDITQEKLAEKLGKDRSTITNFIRLTGLSKEIQDLVSRETISMGHARALLGLKEKNNQKILAKNIIEGGLSVRQTEYKVKEINANDVNEIINETTKTKKKSNKSSSHQIKDVEKKLGNFLGTKVQIKELSSKSKLIIDFYDNSDFDRILEKIGYRKI